MSLVNLDAGENHAGEVGHSRAIITPALAVAIAAYAAGNNVGGVLTLANAMRKIGGSGLIDSLVVVDHANQKAPLDVLIFESGAYVDKTAMPTLSQGDDVKLLARISVLATDYVTVGGSAVASLGALRKVVAAVGSADLKAVISTSGTPTYANAADLMVRFGVLRD
jgi:hypothetical protein